MHNLGYPGFALISLIWRLTCTISVSNGHTSDSWYYSSHHNFLSFWSWKLILRYFPDIMLKRSKMQCFDLILTLGAHMYGYPWKIQKKTVFDQKIFFVFFRLGYSKGWVPIFKIWGKDCIFERFSICQKKPENMSS